MEPDPCFMWILLWGGWFGVQRENGTQTISYDLKIMNKSELFEVFFQIEVSKFRIERRFINRVLKSMAVILSCFSNTGSNVLPNIIE
jgi:hypothetical protein